MTSIPPRPMTPLRCTQPRALLPKMYLDWQVRTRYFHLTPKEISTYIGMVDSAQIAVTPPITKNTFRVPADSSQSLRKKVRLKANRFLIKFMAANASPARSRWQSTTYVVSPVTPSWIPRLMRPRHTMMGTGQGAFTAAAWPQAKKPTLVKTR